MKKIILYFLLALLASPVCAEVEVITLRHRAAEELLPVIRPLLDKDGVASGMNNQLILRTSSRNLAEIKQLLPDIDTAPRLLKITVMQNVDSETVERLTGLSVEAGQGADRLRAHVVSTRSLDDDKKTQQVQVVEGGRALISMGQSVPVPQRQVVQSPWSTQVIDSTQYRDVRSGFYVRPRVSGELVTLEITAQNDALAPETGNTVTRVQQVNTTVSGRLGEWMVLGEVSRQAESDGATISTRSVSDVHERRNVLLKVEEMP